METTKFLEAVKNKKGQYLPATWNSKVAVPSKSSDVVIKTSTATISTGKAYANLNQNKGIETGALPWGEWKVYPWVITHKGQDYARLYLADNFKVKQTYTINGKPATKKEAQAVTLPSAWTKKSGGPTLPLSVKMESVEVK